MQLADDDNAAVAQLLTDYYRAFSTLDAQAVEPYFHQPSQLVSPAGVVPTPTRAAVAATFQPVMNGREPYGATSCCARNADGASRLRVSRSWRKCTGPMPDACAASSRPATLAGARLSHATTVADVRRISLWQGYSSDSVSARSMKSSSRLSNGLKLRVARL
jgi:hypothetical protein